jgi:hypothetical protein
MQRRCQEGQIHPVSLEWRERLVLQYVLTPVDSSRMRGQLWTCTARMRKYGRPRSHRTTGHVPFRRARFPAAISEDDCSTPFAVLVFCDIFFFLLASLLPGSSFLSFQVCITVSDFSEVWCGECRCPMRKRPLLPFLVCPSLKGADDQ